jgi:hypothetical protein
VKDIKDTVLYTRRGRILLAGRMGNTQAEVRRVITWFNFSRSGISVARAERTRSVEDEVRETLGVQNQ